MSDPKMQSPYRVGSLSERADYVAVDTQMTVTVTLAVTGGYFTAVLLREDRRWFDDDPTPEFVEQVVCERQFATPLPAVFAAVDDWLFGGHKLRVLPHSWTPCESGPDVGVALLLEGCAVPVHPVVAGPLGCWG